MTALRGQRISKQAVGACALRTGAYEPETRQRVEGLSARSVGPVVASPAAFSTVASVGSRLLPRSDLLLLKARIESSLCGGRVSCALGS